MAKRYRTEELYTIKDYAETHSIVKTAEHFGCSKGTVIKAKDLEDRRTFVNTPLNNKYDVIKTLKEILELVRKKYWMLDAMHSLQYTRSYIVNTVSKAHNKRDPEIQDLWDMIKETCEQNILTGLLKTSNGDMQTISDAKAQFLLKCNYGYVDNKELKALVLRAKELKLKEKEFEYRKEQDETGGAGDITVVVEGSIENETN